MKTAEMPRCKWCGCSLPPGMFATCFENPNDIFCEPEAVTTASDHTEEQP